MHTIVFSNLKGGVGKTTLADLVAYMLEDRGYDVGFYDLDGQGGQAHDSAAEAHEWQIVDMPGRLDDDTIESLSQADLIVVPYIADMADYEPTRRFLDLIGERLPQVPVMHVLNMYDKHSADERNFRETGALPADYVIPRARVIKKAHNEGSVIPKMYAHTPGARALDGFVDELIERTE